MRTDTILAPVEPLDPNEPYWWSSGPIYLATSTYANTVKWLDAQIAAGGMVIPLRINDCGDEPADLE